jgi:hypothetical protein
MKKILVLVTVLALIAALAIPLAVSATTVPTASGATTVIGTVASVAELTAPNAGGTWNLGPLALGSNGPFTASDGSVTDNNPKGYYVRVSSNYADGKMESTTGTTTSKLGSALSVTTGTLSSITVGLDGQTCEFSNTPTGAVNIPLSVSQTIASTDAAGSYSIILTYTLTENAN